MSVYNTNDKSFYYTKTQNQQEQIDYLVLQKLSKVFDYGYNNLFVMLLLNQDLFKNIEEIFGKEKVWELYLNIKKIYEKTSKLQSSNSKISRIDRINFKIKKVKVLIDKIRYKLKIRTRLLRLIGKINKYQNQINTDILIFDDVFPHPLSPFRYTEYTEYLKHFKKIKIISNGQSLCCFKEEKSLQSIINEYFDKFPSFVPKLDVYKLTTSYNPVIIYVNFLGNAIHHDLGYSIKVPFIVNLYPGGLLEVNNAITDNSLKKYLTSPYCKKVIVTQDYVYDYLINNQLCPKEKIEFIFGVVTPLELLGSKVENKKRYGFQKNVLDVCFVAHKYTSDGRDKGYDKFIESAHILIKKYDNIKFHVVGPFDCNVIDVSKIREKIQFYGTQPTGWFKDFYKNKDIIVSPNIPFTLSPGSFDGFPTASVTEAGLHEVAMFVTDELDMNKSKFIDGEEIIIIKPNSKVIVEKLEFYLKNPNKLKSISELGAMKIKDLYSYEKQITKRISIIQNELDKLR
jgi:glycosyltransferase involved in cell wall biosynthesis